MLMAAGCGGGGSGAGGIGGNNAPSAKHHLHGAMHGGQNPVAGASVYLIATTDTGYRSTDTAVLGSTTTDGNGNWSINSFTCPSPIVPGATIAGDAQGRSVRPGLGMGISPETYLLAFGGDSGSGDNNAIVLMAAVGPCDQIQASTTVVINELTTIAGQWALQQFADNTGGEDIGTSITNLTGLSNAYATIANLVDTNPSDLSVSGGPSSFLPTAAQCASGTPPVNCDGLERLNTLADIIAACVNSSGRSSMACQTLFCDATPGDSFSGTCSGPAQVSDTLGAAHFIAQNPTNNVPGLFALATPNAPFEPTLAAIPDGWEIALNFAPSGALFDAPDVLALDGSGNVFVANCGIECSGSSNGSVSELAVATSYAIGLNFNPSGAMLNEPFSLALDGSANVFVANSNGNSVSELTAASSYATGSKFAPSGAMFDDPVSLALDGSDNVFVANLLPFSGGSVSELTESSSYGMGSNFSLSGAGSALPRSLALDVSGNVFVANFLGNRNSGSVSELTQSSSYATGLNFAPEGAAFNNPRALMLDGSGNIFVANEGRGGGVSELEAPSYATGLNFAPAGADFNGPISLALDGSGNIFVANVSGGSVSELTQSSSYATGLNFAPGGAGFNGPVSLALDGSGNVFAANEGGNSVR